MKEDYLWNKTGSDQEIEELEETLAVFRCRQTSAPPFPAVGEAAIVTAKKPSWILGLRIALSGSAAAIVAASVWIWAVQEREVSPVAVVDTRAVPFQQNEVHDESEDIEALPQTAALQPADKPIHTSAVVNRRKPPADLKNLRRNSVQRVSPALTIEEKYAYDRLMLALSITSSKLRIVRDTIDGNPESDTDRSGKR